MSGLTVRQHERKPIVLHAEFAVADAHRQQVCFSPSSPALDAFLVRGTAVDVSTGGMGLELAQFIPKMCEGLVRIFSDTPSGTGVDGQPVYDVIFEHQVKVRRIYMASHEPTYAAGVSFIDPEPGLDDKVREILLVGERAAARLEAGNA